MQSFQRNSASKKQCSGAFRSRAVCLYAIFFLVSYVGIPSVTLASTKVAFVADQDVYPEARAVLAMIADEDVDLVLIQGDLGYRKSSASVWESVLSDELGKNFPVLSVVGNHENYEWPLYKRFIEQRIDRADGLECDGDVAVKAICKFENINIVQVAPGITEVPGVDGSDNYHDYIRASFDGKSRPWRICSWHKNQTEMQVYQKSDAVGWDVFDACLDAGAMVVMGHAHAYSRTHLLDDFRTQSIVHTNDEMTIKPGQSLAVVSGLGGRDIRPQLRNGNHFASVYTSSQGATHGALFCDFDDDKADCYFKAINGAIPDRFTLYNGRNKSNEVVDVTNSNARVSSDDDLNGVFTRTDKSEFLWIARQSSGVLGSVWIDASCAAQLGGPRYAGDWRQLVELAPGLDKIADPCEEGELSGVSSPPPRNTDGYVFARTDKREYRWIKSTDAGQVGSTWISENCASQLGGATVSGSWLDLEQLAPALDAVASPCKNGLVISSIADTFTQGFVLERDDKNEYRWIDKNSSGQIGSTWIDKDCATRLGGPSQTGDWSYLMRIAPAFDTLEYPCF